MAKRAKKLEKGIKSLKRQIEDHFIKTEKDIQEERVELGAYHIKEIDKSLLKALELKIGFLGRKSKDDSVKKYKNRLEKLKKKLKLDLRK
ncbi:MAG: hypothetical protein AABX50_01375 [Nanoarchaeota archaeon]